VYRAYARAVGFHIDACRPRQAQEKGKVEAKVKLSRLLLDPGSRAWASLQELQEWSDERLDRWCRRALCPATGCSVYESWQKELLHLAPLPILPEPFDVAVTRPVQRDCMVAFEGRRYSVPFRLAGSRVEVRGCSGSVQIFADGRVVRSYPRHTAERLVIDPSCWDGEATETVVPPPPLGRMGSKIQQLWEMPVEQRPMDLYAHLAEVAR
ncbi:MAG TPA: hypothetical protein VLV83_16740, partial [Acidobacteriota bacterium]|nr:hypothetical protein [Acidobacteriota bacterium]